VPGTCLAPAWHRANLAEVLLGTSTEVTVGLLLALVIALLILSLPTWPYSAGWGYYPSSGLGILLLIAVVLLLSRRRV
jgi:uncharacterized protein DUF3309